MLLYRPHPNTRVYPFAPLYVAVFVLHARRSLWALSAYEWIPFLPLSQLNGGANVGCGPAMTLFLSLIFSQCRHTDGGHGLFTTLFLGLILFSVPITPCDTMLYWPSPN